MLSSLTINARVKSALLKTTTMGKKKDDDVDDTLEDWTDQCEGWHTLVYMLKTGFISTKNKKEGGEGPAWIRSQSSKFKYNSTKFASNVTRIRSAFKDKPEKFKVDLGKVDPEVIKMVAKKMGKGAGAGAGIGTPSDQDGIGLGGLDEEFGGKFSLIRLSFHRNAHFLFTDLDVDDEEDDEDGEVGDEKPKETPKKNPPSVAVPRSALSLPTLLLPWVGANQKQYLTVVVHLPAGSLRKPPQVSGLTSYVNAYITNPRTVTVAIDMTDDSIFNPQKFHDKFWRDAGLISDHAKVVAHSSAMKTLKKGKSNTRIIKTCLRIWSFVSISVY